MSKVRTIDLPAPVILEAVPSTGNPGAEAIVVKNLGPDGATLVVDYPTIKAGDVIQVWHKDDDSEYDVTKTSTGLAVTFKVPKAIFNGTVITFIYGVNDLAFSKIRIYLVE
jgi:hypothetical protein